MQIVWITFQNGARHWDGLAGVATQRRGTRGHPRAGARRGWGAGAWRAGGRRSPRGTPAAMAYHRGAINDIQARWCMTSNPPVQARRKVTRDSPNPPRCVRVGGEPARKRGGWILMGKCPGNPHPSAHYPVCGVLNDRSEVSPKRNLTEGVGRHRCDSKEFANVIRASFQI